MVDEGVLHFRDGTCLLNFEFSSESWWSEGGAGKRSAWFLIINAGTLMGNRGVVIIGALGLWFVSQQVGTDCSCCGVDGFLGPGGWRLSLIAAVFCFESDSNVWKFFACVRGVCSFWSAARTRVEASAARPAFRVSADEAWSMLSAVETFLWQKTDGNASKTHPAGSAAFKCSQEKQHFWAHQLHQRSCWIQQEINAFFFTFCGNASRVQVSFSFLKLNATRRNSADGLRLTAGWTWADWPFEAVQMWKMSVIEGRSHSAGQLQLLPQSGGGRIRMLGNCFDNLISF